MKRIPSLRTFGPVAAFLAALTLAPLPTFAHCDTLDGPVVKAAEKALEQRDVRLVLPWVQGHDEAEIRQTFDHTLAVRQLGPQARALADRFFFETLVRVHRAGEGAPYAGLKPAGTDLGPIVPAADRALTAGDVKPLIQRLQAHLSERVQAKFKDALTRREFAPDQVAAGREYVRAYVEFVHYVEGIHAALVAAGHAHEPGPATEPHASVPTVPAPAAEATAPAPNHAHH